MSLKISKDEARFLAEMVKGSKWESWSSARSKEEASEWAKSIAVFEKKLEDHGQDHRRLGRTSNDDWRGLMLRLVYKYRPR